MKYGIVTDSTCDLLPEEVEELDVRVVPLRFLIEGQVYADGVDMTRAEFLDRMQTGVDLPGTSQPAPADFMNVYKDLADEGCEEIVSLHMSGKLSGTVEAAHLAARMSPVPVVVADSRSTTMGLGYQVRELAHMRDLGVFPTKAVRRLRPLQDSMSTIFVPQTLDNLVRGGRVSKLAGMASGVLGIKVLISMDEDGGAINLGKAKGEKRAFSTIAQRAADLSSEHGPLVVSYFHVRNPEGVQRLNDAFQAADVEMAFQETRSVSPVLAVHGGLGVVGVTFMPVGLMSAPLPTIARHVM